MLEVLVFYAVLVAILLMMVTCYTLFVAFIFQRMSTNPKDERKSPHGAYKKSEGDAMSLAEYEEWQKEKELEQRRAKQFENMMIYNGSKQESDE